VLADNPRRMEGDCHCLDTFLAGDLEGGERQHHYVHAPPRLIDGTADCAHASVPLYADGKRPGVLNMVSSDWRIVCRGFVPAYSVVGAD
jgi:two-component system NarL family sensor kinase